MSQGTVGGGDVAKLIHLVRQAEAGYGCYSVFNCITRSHIVESSFIHFLLRSSCKQQYYSVQKEVVTNFISTDLFTRVCSERAW